MDENINLTTDEMATPLAEDTSSNLIYFRILKGTKSEFKTLTRYSEGALYYCTDTGELFIAQENNSIKEIGRIGKDFAINSNGEIADNGDFSEGHGEIFNDYINNRASGEYSHAEGYYTSASGDHSHAEGYHTTASKFSSHAEGFITEASGESSHSEGGNTVASGYCSHVEGEHTIANGGHQHVQGKYNIPNSNYAHIVGNGNSATVRSNAHTIDWSGNAWFAGNVYVGGTEQEEGTELQTRITNSNSIVPFEYGGTNANSKEGARDSLDVYSKSEVNNIIEDLINSIKTDMELITTDDIDEICNSTIEIADKEVKF